MGWESIYRRSGGKANIMSLGRIYYTKPSIGAKEIACATDAATNGWGEHCYEYIGKFENAFAKHLGVKHAIPTSSCTGGIAFGVG